MNAPYEEKEIKCEMDNLKESISVLEFNQRETEEKIEDYERDIKWFRYLLYTLTGCVISIVGIIVTIILFLIKSWYINEFTSEKYKNLIAKI